jgi:predicted nuclease with TOPRIM domain
MKFSKILIEGRVEDFETKYTQKYGAQNVQRIVNMVTPKYLEWAGKNLDSVNFDENYGKLVAALNNFDKISHNLPQTDINQYKSLEQLLTAIENYNNTTRREVEKHEGGNVVYNDDRFYVVNPLTHQASCYYGKGTKWCTAATGDEHFKRYNTEGKLFYIIDKTKQSSDPFYKIAILRNFDGSESFWDAKDDSIPQIWGIIGKDEFDKVSETINQYLEQEFADQLKIYRDKELAKKERERLARIETQRILDRKTAEANERRLEGEWELGPDCPDVGLKAHALLDWLVDTSDVSAITNEDRIEIQRLKDEIERLNAEYDAGEDADTGLLDEISDLEEELSELEEKIDVYNIIPTGGHYDLQSFEVINSADLDGREYAVGDEGEIKSSCYDYVEQLIDDIGYEGFSKGFAEDYISQEQVKDYAYDFYYDDVRDNPESYFDENQRELSREQEDRILQYNTRKERIEMMISSLEGRMSDMEDEDEINELQEKVDELNDELDEIDTEIEDIEGDPEGEYPDDLIDDKAEELAKDAAYDPMDWLKEMGLDIENFIDKRDFIEGVIDADGYGHTLSSYDGNADEVIVEGTTYWIIRLN